MTLEEKGTKILLMHFRGRIIGMKSIIMRIDRYLKETYFIILFTTQH